jgi:hypothetical protein
MHFMAAFHDYALLPNLAAAFRYFDLLLRQSLICSQRSAA